MPPKKITFYKLMEKVQLQDGTVFEKGTSVRYNYKEGPFFNVEAQDSHKSKKIFWVTEDKVKPTTTRTEKWTTKMVEEHQKDIMETWFESSAEKSKKEETKKTIRKRMVSK